MTGAIELLDPEPETLTVAVRAATALKSTETEAHLVALAAKNVGLVAILDKAGREQAHGAAMELKRTRVSITNIGKSAREDAKKFSEAVIAEEKRLIAIIEPEETRLLALRDDWDAAQAAIKAEAERKERARIMAINERIAELRGYVNLALECRTSERIATLIEKLSAAAITPELYQEFESEAAGVKAAALLRLGEIHAAKKADEEERARIKAEQEAAAEALRKEREALEQAQAEAKRVADESAAKARAEAESLAAQRAAFEAEQEAARLALVEEARQIAQERANLEAAQAAATPVATSAVNEAIALAESAQVAIETVAATDATEVLVLKGELLSIPMEPARPDDMAIVNAVAAAFNTDYVTALSWLEEIDFHELNR